MSFAPGPQDKEIALEVFGGLVTEMAPPDLPLGVSPDCQEVEFQPGNAFSRRCFQKVFASPLYPTANITYGKSYVDPQGVIRNLYFYDNGALTVENITTNPGVETLLSQTSALGCRAKSITANGREYIAISDGLHGQEIPFQYDGTNLDRVTQDGPGAPPTVQSFTLPSVAMLGPAAPATLVITAIFVDQRAFQPNGYWTAINIFVAAGTAAVGTNVTVSGTGSGFDGGTFLVTTVPGPGGAITCSAFFPNGTANFVGAGTLTLGTGVPNVTMTRAGNVVSVTTATAHNLVIGYQAQITGITAATVGTSISKIVINNENLPGIATVTTASVHGLIPGLFVSITGVNAVVAGGAGAASIARAGQIVTVTTGAHGLTPGAVVTLSGFTTASFNTTAIVTTVNSATTFTFIQADVDATDTGGTVSINWPIPNTPTPTFFEVISSPTTTTFQVAISYSNSPATGWTSGTVKYEWNGTFFVASVPSTTTFTYKQYGPDATTTDVGTVAPFGQATPGLHQVQVAFQTRAGYITRPSPPAKVVMSGGDYYSVTNLPTGPSNVIARVILFTGANGAFFFYIPSTPEINGQIVGTQTLVDDNTTQSVVLDFADNTLFAALGTSIQGNNLAAQIVLDGALGFGFYASRLFSYGQRNRIQGFLNLGFDGGALPSTPTIPTGWALTAGTTGGSIQPGHYGSGWQIVITPGGTFCGLITQGAHEDAYGAPIVQPNQPLKLRVWVSTTSQAADVQLDVTLSSVAATFVSTATITGPSMSLTGGFVEVAFSNPVPILIPSDFLLSVYAASNPTNATVLVDEISIIYSESPYLTKTFWSYANNPEAFDGVTGYSGPANDTRQAMGAEIIRNSLCLWTQDPTGRLHETSDNELTEPAGWRWNEVAANCGLLSTFGLTVSQADDSTGSGGEEFAMWASLDGAMIFSGGNADKISQEIQPDWESINAAGYTGIWALNDYARRIVFFGLPTGAELSGPSIIYPMSYRQLNTAAAIANSPPVHVGYSGKLITSDNTRKWTRWRRTMNGGALMYRAGGILQTVLLGGNGQQPGHGTGFGNAYTLSAVKFTDDDYGQVNPYYIPACFVGHEAEQSLQLGMHRKTLAYLMAYIADVAASKSNVKFTVLCDRIGNPWALTCTRPLVFNPNNDLEWNGGCAQAQRFFIKIETSPQIGTDNGFNLQKLVLVLRESGRMKVRGAPQS